MSTIPEAAPLDIEAVEKRLSDRFGDAVVGRAGGDDDSAGDPWIEVAPDGIAEIARFLRDEDDLWFDSLMCLSSVDRSGLKAYQKSKEPEAEAARRFFVVYHLHSMLHRHRVHIKCFLPEEDPKLPSVADVWPTADWHEREAFDVMGITFEGHPDLRRILLPDDWEGHPLRKDYETPELYRGMPARGLPVPPPDAIEKQRLKDEEERRKLLAAGARAEAAEAEEPPGGASTEEEGG